MKPSQLYLIVGQIWCAVGLSAESLIIFVTGIVYTLLSVVLERAR